MSSEPAVFDGATKIASDLSRGAYSSREIAQAFISRIERFDAEINAVVVRRFDEALKEADAAPTSGLHSHAGDLLRSLWTQADIRCGADQGR